MPTPKKIVASDGAITFKVRFRYAGRNTSETFVTENEARAFCADIEYRGVDEAMRKIEDEAAAERAELAAESGPTVDDIFDEWIERTARRVRSDRTVADYRRDWDNWVRPTFGRRRIASLTVGDVQAWLDAMERGTLHGQRRPLAPKSIGDRHFLLHGVCQWAASSARPGGPVLTGDPCAGTILPKRRARTAKGLTPAEWTALHRALVQLDPDAADLCLFMVATGWRYSEATALSAFSVEDDGRTMHVTTGWVIRRNADGVDERVEDTKSARSRRRIVVDHECADMIRRRLATVHGDGLVFTTRRGSQWHYNNFASRAWRPAVKVANLTRNPTPHWLRHTHAGWLLMSGGASLADVQARLGHSNISTTVDIYGSMVQDAPAPAVDAVAAMRQGKTAPALAELGHELGAYTAAGELLAGELDEDDA